MAVEVPDALDAEIPPLWQKGGDSRFPLGTDAQGRDMLSAILFGTGISLIIGLLAVLIQAVLGITIGVFAGYRGGRWEVRMVTFTSGSPMQYTNAADVEAAASRGDVEIGEVVKRFTCPLIRN